MIQKMLIRRTSIFLIFGIFLFGASALAVSGFRSRYEKLSEAKAWTSTHANVYVSTVSPKVGEAEQFIDVPGQLAAYNDASIYARVGGYVATWRADIGAEVKVGEVLAVIDAPELDQQLLRARAELLSAQAGAKLSETTYRRRQALLTSQVVSRQELEERSADLDLKKAAVAAAQADVTRLETQAKYKHITAPFSGIITSRNIDLGNLIDAGARDGAALFSISDISRMRIYIDVPYTYASLIEIGAASTFTTPSEPSRPHTAIVDSMSRAINTSTGTTRMQLILNDPDKRLMPGGYVNVRIALSGRRDTLSIPANALIINRDGTQVAVLADKHRVALRKVNVLRELGREILIASDLSVNDRLIINPRDGILEGEIVHDTTIAQETKSN